MSHTVNFTVRDLIQRFDYPTAMQQMFVVKDGMHRHMLISLFLYRLPGCSTQVGYEDQTRRFVDYASECGVIFKKFKELEALFS